MTAQYKNVGEAIDAVVAERGVPRTWESAFEVVVEGMRRIMHGRHVKYGPNNINRHGMVGVAVRLGDKLERFDNLLARDDAPDVFVDESLEDTLGDMANYPIIGIMYGRDWWNLPAGVLGQTRTPTPVVTTSPRCSLAEPALESGVPCVPNIDPGDPAMAAFSFFVCRDCGDTFCGAHIDPEAHACEGVEDNG